MGTVTYSLNVPTIAVTIPQRKALIVPAGAILRFDELPPHYTGFVRVMWENQTVEMFACDLRERCEKMVVAAA